MQIKEVDLEKTELFSIGRQYSKNVLAIHFVNLPNQKNKYIYYKIDDIEKEIPLVSDLFIVSRPLTMHSGKVKAQIIVRDEANETIDLTKNFTMIIEASNYSGIGDDENYPDDPNIKNYFVKIDEKVNSFEELTNLVQTKLDNGDFVGEQGPKGEKGDPGDVTEEYRNLASQIAQNASDAQTSATNAQTSASNAHNILDDTKDFANQTKSEMNQIKTDTNTLKEEANASATNAKSSEDKAKEYADNLQASTDDISQLKEDLSYLKNNELIGLLKNEYVEINSNTVYVPFTIKSGDVVTISTIDGTNFSQNRVYIDFYDDTNTVIDFYGVDNTFGNSRTLTWNKANVAKIKCRDNTNNRVFRVSKPNTSKKLNFESSGLNINDSNFDLNNCKPNLIYTISAMCYNSPGVGTCFTFARNAGEPDTYVQFFVTTKNDLHTRYKRYGSGWTEWEEYEKANFNYSAKLSIFDKIGVVGDSFASGEIYRPDGTLIGDNYKISWLQQLARRNGFTGFNFSGGGMSTRTWLTSERGLTKLNSSDICDLYILALGINDYYGLGESYLGTENDITNKADTFYGNYAKIIEAIQAKSSTSKLIMLDIAIRNNESPATKALIKKFNEAIVTIANHYNIPVAYQTKNRYFELDMYRDSMYHGHPSIVGYSAMATQLENTISECMFANQSYFEL